MQGFILNTQLVRDEDLVVTILTKDSIKRLYRFYGVRHSIVSIGNFIDFEEEVSYKVNINRLKDVLLISFDTMYNNQSMLDYKIFIKLLHKHFRDIDIIEDFYFEMLKTLIEDLNYQNAKRAIIESYLRLLEHEGRLNSNFKCLFCNKVIEENLNIGRSFVLSHKNCMYSYFLFDYNKTKRLFQDKNTFMLEDSDVEELWNILLQGI
jgi:recombinational DNA repair protein (RecF pathway)